MCILNNIPLTQTRQPVFVQLLHHVYRVSQAVLGHQRVNVENCIKTLTEVGKFALSCGLLFHLTCIFSFYQFQVFMKELMIFFFAILSFTLFLYIAVQNYIKYGKKSALSKRSSFFLLFFFLFTSPLLNFFYFHNYLFYIFSLVFESFDNLCSFKLQNLIFMSK